MPILSKRKFPDRYRREEFYNANGGEHLCSNFRRVWSLFRTSPHVYKSGAINQKVYESKITRSLLGVPLRIVTFMEEDALN